jgi:hypothetical protein
MDFKELGCDNMDGIHLVNVMIQQCTLMNRIMIPSACLTDGVYLH